MSTLDRRIMDETRTNPSGMHYAQNVSGVPKYRHQSRLEAPPLHKSNLIKEEWSTFWHDNKPELNYNNDDGPEHNKTFLHHLDLLTTAVNANYQTRAVHELNSEDDMVSFGLLPNWMFLWKSGPLPLNNDNLKKKIFRISQVKVIGFKIVLHINYFNDHWVIKPTSQRNNMKRKQLRAVAIHIARGYVWVALETRTRDAELHSGITEWKWHTKDR